MWIRALIALAAVLMLAPTAHAEEVRMFAVGNKHRTQDALTHADYRNKMAALMDAGFPNRSAYVQAGVDDVASHLQGADPGAPSKALVVFPEDVGLINVLIGSRGETARRQTTALGAIPSLFEPYSRQVAYYAEKYPGQPALRLLFLALTDTLYRSFYETFRELAMEHDVYIAAAIFVQQCPPRVELARLSRRSLTRLLREEILHRCQGSV